MWQSYVTEVRFLGFLVCYVTAVIDMFSREVLAIEADPTCELDIEKADLEVTVNGDWKGRGPRTARIR